MHKNLYNAIRFYYLLLFFTYVIRSSKPLKCHALYFDLTSLTYALQNYKTSQHAENHLHTIITEIWACTVSFKIQVFYWSPIFKLFCGTPCPLYHRNCWKKLTRLLGMCGYIKLINSAAYFLHIFSSSFRKLCLPQFCSIGLVRIVKLLIL